MGKACRRHGGLLLASATLAALACLSCASVALGAPGDLDHRYGNGGVHHSHVDPSSSRYPTVSDAAPDPDGGFVLLQYTHPKSGEDANQVVRLTPGGHSDDSFGESGTFRLPGDFHAAALSVRDDGRIVVVGWLPGSADPDNSRDLAAIALTSSGQPDPGFGSSGVSRIDLPQNAVMGVDTIPAPGGETIVAAAVDYTTMQLVELGDDGSLDAGFGSGGGTEPIEGTADNVARDGDGNYLLDGGDDTAPTSHVARYDSAGTLDSSYGENGISAANVGGGDSVTDTALAVDGSGGAVIASAPTESTGHSTPPQRMRRLDASGQPVPGFDATAALAHQPRTARQLGIEDLAFDSEGRILLGGSWFADLYTSAPSDPAIARVLPDGSLDPSFGDGGKSIFPSQTLTTDDLRSIAQQVNGTVTAAGVNGASARFFTGPGPANADADRFLDRRDSCPRVKAFGKHSGGCPRVGVRLKMRYHRRRGGHSGFSGKLKTKQGCRVVHPDRPQRKRGVNIRVMRVRHGRDRLIGSVHVHQSGGTWKLRKFRRHGRYYAKYRGRINPELGACQDARSKRVRIR